MDALQTQWAKRIRRSEVEAELRDERGKGIPRHIVTGRGARGSERHREIDLYKDLLTCGLRSEVETGNGRA